MLNKTLHSPSAASRENKWKETMCKVGFWIAAVQACTVLLLQVSLLYVYMVVSTPATVPQTIQLDGRSYHSWTTNQKVYGRKHYHGIFLAEGSWEHSWRTSISNDDARTEIRTQHSANTSKRRYAWAHLCRDPGRNMLSHPPPLLQDIQVLR
jgi:hypothetical protein